MLEDAVALGATVLFATAVAATAAGKQTRAACAILAPDARPIIDVAGKGNRAPLALFALGFSKTGHFAWLERRVGFDSDDRIWLLHVVNLDNDRTVAEREFTTKRAGLAAMCARHGAAIARVLDRFQIERGAALPLTQPGTDGAQDLKDLKELGLSWKRDVDPGQPPRGALALVGLVHSPYEPRVAVLFRQRMIGTEAAELIMIRVLGGRLDRGWQTPAPPP